MFDANEKKWRIHYCVLASNESAIQREDYLSTNVKDSDQLRTTFEIWKSSGDDKVCSTRCNGLCKKKRNETIPQLVFSKGLLTRDIHHNDIKFGVVGEMKLHLVQLFSMN